MPCLFFVSKQYCEHNIYASRVPLKCVLPGGLSKWNVNPSSFRAKKNSQNMAGSATGKLRSQEGGGGELIGYFF